MKILFLDDDERRHEIFSEEIAERKVTLVQTRTVPETINQLSANDFDIVFLDHDLGGEVYVNSDNKNTGYQVAKFMVDFFKDKERKPTVIVHSYNFSGAMNMCKILKDNGFNVEYRPFDLTYMLNDLGI